MYTLEDISLYPFIFTLEKSILKSPKNKELYEFLIKYKIFDFKRLEEFIRMNYPLVNTQTFYKMLEKAYKTLCKLNTGQLEPQTYFFDNWNNSDYFKKLIKSTDDEVVLNDILLRNPLNIRYQKTDIDWCQVSLAKQLMNKLAVNGNNAFAECMRYVGPHKLDSLANNISLYRWQLQQVISETTTDFYGNLFFKDQDTKEKIILEDIKSIVYYLTDNGSRFLWGNMSNTDKARLIKLSLTPGLPDYIVRDNLVKLLANYTTLSEVKIGLARSRTLDKFILE